ncbi:hypothetical protein PV326_010534 [Microctonus aethiopoides]|nr:hypothetical protein PV326_010534 [Microctonus aethiopoides]
MNFDKLNEVSRLNNFFRTKSWNELEVDKNYSVSGIKIVKTKFGDNIVLILDEEFEVFLPSRIKKYLLNDRKQYELFTETTPEGKLTMRYIGGKYKNCEFSYTDKL